MREFSCIYLESLPEIKNRIKRRNPAPRHSHVLQVKQNDPTSSCEAWHRPKSRKIYQTPSITSYKHFPFRIVEDVGACKERQKKVFFLHHWPFTLSSCQWIRSHCLTLQLKTINLQLWILILVFCAVQLLAMSIVSLIIVTYTNCVSFFIFCRFSFIYTRKPYSIAQHTMNRLKGECVCVRCAQNLYLSINHNSSVLEN